MGKQLGKEKCCVSYVMERKKGLASVWLHESGLFPLNGKEWSSSRFHLSTRVEIGLLG